MRTSEVFTELCFYPLGEVGLTLEFGPLPTEAVRSGVARLTRSLERRPFVGLLEVVPAYTTLTVFADPARWTPATLERELRARLAEPSDDIALEPREHTLEVCYAGECAPDLALVSARTGLSVPEVVRLHSDAVYRVELVGFAPGFGYLSGLDPRLNVPRRPSPRSRVPAGSVGLAGAQTGVYALETPGGWQLIGRTLAPLFSPGRAPPGLLRPGDLVRFLPVPLARFRAQQGEPR